MNKIKGLLKLVAIFIIIKVIFFFSAEFSKNQAMSANTAPRPIPATAPIVSSAHAVVPKDGFRRYVAGYGVSVELPEKWFILAHSQVKDIADIGSKAMNSQDKSKKTPLAANSSADQKQNQAVFRVSFSDNLLTESEIQTATAAEIKEACDALNNGLNPGLEKMGTHLVRKPYCSVGKIAGKTAFIADYQRSGAYGPDPWRVLIYQIPLSAKTAMITVSYQLVSDAAKNQIEEILSSLLFE
ncbi:hypothetical protein [Sodalis sp. RH19]|uniref:hypothetical protein n=1 Tax=Sodalis sp. RH19 TaxID=3394334 RepID=UPI0039B61CC9